MRKIDLLKKPRVCQRCCVVERHLLGFPLPWSGAILLRRSPCYGGDLGTCHLPPPRLPLSDVSLPTFPAGFGVLCAETPRGSMSTGFGGLSESSIGSRAMGQPRCWRVRVLAEQIAFLHTGSGELQGRRNTSVTPTTAAPNENAKSSPAMAK